MEEAQMKLTEHNPVAFLSPVLIRIGLEKLKFVLTLYVRLYLLYFADLAVVLFIWLEPFLFCSFHMKPEDMISYSRNKHPNGTGAFICLEASLSWLVGTPKKEGLDLYVQSNDIESCEWIGEMISFERSFFFPNLVLPWVCMCWWVGILGFQLRATSGVHHQLLSSQDQSAMESWHLRLIRHNRLSLLCSFNTQSSPLANSVVYLLKALDCSYPVHMYNVRDMPGSKVHDRWRLVWDNPERVDLWSMRSPT